MIDVRHLCFRYAKKGSDILRDVSFTLPNGKIGILLGPNGAGKSTLIRCILGFVKVQEGEILLNGTNLAELKARERALQIAYVPQKVSFAPLTVYDAVMLGRIPYFGIAPKAKDHEAVVDALEEFGLTPLAPRNVLELSGGEQQIVAIARAYVQGASILVFDEPTSNLDIANQRLVLEQIKKLAGKGLSILLSMHDINEALELGDRFFFIKENHIYAEGDASACTKETIEATFGVRGEIHHINGKPLFIIGGNRNE